MKLRLLCVTTLLLFATEAAGAYAADGARKSFEIFRTDSPPIIDGKLDDAVWRATEYVDDFHQTSPGDGTAPTERTVVRVTYDDEFLYIAANMLDSEPQAIQAKQMIQGQLFRSDDRFWVTLDSFNNKRNDYFFQVNANGVRRDALRENNARFIDE
ncbi:MAG: hypothetical protein OEU59_01500, partial [Gammaproteobacteria bacterium]|nr:hypothetical protein [Gammaproteobacteria bacterium]